MWVPRDVQEIEDAIAAGRLEETHTFDGKALPGRNKDIAIDVCAMTVDGGSLLYGAGEDLNRRLTERRPFPLAGERNQIDQIVQTSIVEVPVVEIREYPLPEDATTGYIVVAIQQSPRAPHQVAARGDMRYYGRGATGNRILTEREVAELYARRQRWELDRGAHLATVVASAPFEPLPEAFAYLHAYARPVTFDGRFLRGQLERREVEQELRDELVRAINIVDDFSQYHPDLRQLRGWQLFGAEGIVLEGGIDHARRVIRMTIGHDGEVRLFACAGARPGAEVAGPGEGPVNVFDELTAGNLTSFFSAAGAFYRRAGYYGHVDIGVAVTGIRGAVAHFLHQQGRYERAYPAADFRSTERVVAADLAERPRDAAFELLRRFFDGLAGVGYEPRIELRPRPG
jgi:hypothetical protein